MANNCGYFPSISGRGTDIKTAMTGGNITVHNSSRCISVGGDLTIQNNADVLVRNIGRQDAIKVTGEIYIKDSSLGIYNAEDVSTKTTSTYAISKMPPVRSPPLGLLSDPAGLNGVEPATWNIILNNTQPTAVLTLNSATVTSGDDNKITEGNGTVDVAGDGALAIRTIADSTINFRRGTGIATKMAGDTTYTSVNNAKLSVLDTENNTAKGGSTNPQTGDATPVVLFVALATLAAAAVTFTKKRNII